MTGTSSATNRLMNSTQRVRISGCSASLWLPLYAVTHTSGSSSSAGIICIQWLSSCSSCMPPTRNTGTSISFAHSPGVRSAKSSGSRNSVSLRISSPSWAWPCSRWFSMQCSSPCSTSVFAHSWPPSGAGPIFHDDSYGYRPGRSALDAVGACRQRCWKADWGAPG